MVTIEDLKKAANKAALAGGTEFVDYNTKCNKIIDVIYDKVLDLMSKDKKLGVVRRNAVVKGANFLKGSTKEYIFDMPKDDAHEVIVKIKEIVR